MWVVLYAKNESYFCRVLHQKTRRPHFWYAQVDQTLYENIPTFPTETYLCDLKKKKVVFLWGSYSKDARPHFWYAQVD